MTDIADVARFLDPLALAIVCGGSLAIAAIRSTTADIGRAFVALKAMLTAKPDLDAIVAAAAVRRIEAVAGIKTIACADRIDTAGRFLKQAAVHLSDARTADEFVAWGDGEIAARRARHEGAIGFWRTIADTAPAMGMIGTITGLVQMFAAMEDPGTIGPAMALAMLTTLYGVVVGGALAGPIAARLERLSTLELGWQQAAIDRLATLAHAELDPLQAFQTRGQRLKAVP
ncbi:MotA/TolQ/ExbB proton channel family protein [Sphingomonas sp. 1P06PA]|uniref:motility protein A n=1 Tax=Sphingomonas sp. 1P06PA TaxID=554121 RepID=UPI0039A71DC7